MKTILICVVGTSPAVLTETVWALATGNEPVVPDEIVALTTTTGEKGLRDALFGPDRIWEKMVQELERRTGQSLADKLQFGHRDSFRIFHRAGKGDLADIVTPEDNTAVADQILETLCAYTEDPTTRVYASIAGGRKSMSALMMAAMSLRGRADDHVLHVLVNEPFDKPLTPRFYFPARGATYELCGKKYRSASARIDLIDIPFVRMRDWYQEKFKTNVPRYSELVKSVQAQAPRNYPELVFDFDRGVLLVDGEALRTLNAAEFLTLHAVVNCAPRDVLDELERLRAARNTVNSKVDWAASFVADSARYAKPETMKEDFTRVQSDLRKKLKACAVLAPFVDELVPKHNKPRVYPQTRISADIPKLRRLFGV